MLIFVGTFGKENDPAMTIQPLPHLFTICKLADPQAIPLDSEFCFVGKTDEELSLVCPTDRVPAGALAREDGFRAFRIEGVLDFSLVGILAAISTRLADAGIGLFTVSTFNTDYVLVKEADLARALAVLRAGGYIVRDHHH